MHLYCTVYIIHHVIEISINGQRLNSVPAGDDMAISVVTRGGPEKYQVTGWLQVDEASKHHEGYYICVAHNKHGSDKQTGRIKIHEKSKLMDGILLNNLINTVYY